jgi:hypothetical protein
VKRHHDGDAEAARLEDDARRQPVEMVDVHDLGLLRFDEGPHGQRGRRVPIGFEPRRARVMAIDGDHAHTVIVRLAQLAIGRRIVLHGMEDGDRPAAGQGPREPLDVDLGSAFRRGRVPAVHDQHAAHDATACACP